MQYTILCVGKVRERFFADAIKEYMKRLSRYGKTEIIEVQDEKTPENASAGMELQIKQKEAERLLKYMRDNMYIMALDLKGKEFDSLAFADHLEGIMLRGVSHIAFVIGGSLGLHPSVLQRADERICFSKMTFPHQLMRVILLEQIYRANRIQKGEPYHK